MASARIAAREPPEQPSPCWWKARERGACEIARAGHGVERWSSKLHPCNQGLPSCSLVLEMCLLLAFPTSRSPSKDAASGRNWYCLDHKSDRTHLRPLYKCFRFWQTGVKHCFSWGCPRQASWVSPLCIKPASLQPGVVCFTVRFQMKPGQIPTKLQINIHF